MSLVVRLKNISPKIGRLLALAVVVIGILAKNALAEDNLPLLTTKQGHYDLSLANPESLLPQFTTKKGTVSTGLSSVLTKISARTKKIKSILKAPTSVKLSKNKHIRLKNEFRALKALRKFYKSYNGANIVSVLSALPLKDSKKSIKQASCVPPKISGFDIGGDLPSSSLNFPGDFEESIDGLNISLIAEDFKSFDLSSQEFSLLILDMASIVSLYPFSLTSQGVLLNTTTEFSPGTYQGSLYGATVSSIARDFGKSYSICLGDGFEFSLNSSSSNDGDGGVQAPVTTPTPLPSPTPKPPSVCDTSAYADADFDGFKGTQCGGTDCNDSNFSVFPGASEICGDGLDNDCNGGDQACPSAEFSQKLEVYESYTAGESGVARSNDPVVIGFPFEKGQISSIDQLRITGASEYQFRPLGYWPDGSVRWALASFLVPSLLANARDLTTFKLENGGTASTSPSICSLTNGVLSADTGSLQVEIRAAKFNVIDRAVANGVEIVSANNFGRFRYGDEIGNEFSSNTTNAQLSIIENGRVRCYAKAIGTFSSGLRYRITYEFVRNKTKVEMVASLINSNMQVIEHKLVGANQGAQIIIDSNVNTGTLHAQFPNTSDALQDFTFSSGESIEVNNFYQTKLATSGGVKTGVDTQNQTGYSVTKNGSSILVPNGGLNAVPRYQYLKISDSSGRSILAFTKFGAYYYPNGYSAKGTGELSVDLVPKSYSSNFFLGHRMAEIRPIAIDFAPSGSAQDIVKRSTFQLIAVAQDRSYWGRAHATEFNTLNPDTINQFFSRSDININALACQNPENQGEVTGWPSAMPNLKVYRSIPSGATAGGPQNNFGANLPDFTFTVAGRGNFTYAYLLGLYRASRDARLTNNLFGFNVNASNAKSIFEAAPSSENVIYISSKLPNFPELLGADPAHNWGAVAFATFYNLTGQEEFRDALENIINWQRVNGFSQSITYIRPLGMQLLAHSVILNYLSQINDVRLEEYRQWLRTFLNNKLLYSKATPDYGTFEISKFGFHFDGSGWSSEIPGQPIDQSDSSLAPEVQELHMPVTRFFASQEETNDALCNADSVRGWMLIQRLGNGMIHTHNVLKFLDPNDSLLEPLRIRILDIAHHASGDTVGTGAYQLDFYNGNSNILYRHCLLNVQDHQYWENYYAVTYLFTFAAQHALSQAEREFFASASLTQLFALAKSGELSCFRDIDPKIQHSINYFLESGLEYQKYPEGTEVPQ